MPGRARASASPEAWYRFDVDAGELEITLQPNLDELVASPDAR